MPMFSGCSSSFKVFLGSLANASSVGVNIVSGPSELRTSTNCAFFAVSSKSPNFSDLLRLPTMSCPYVATEPSKPIAIHMSNLHKCLKSQSLWLSQISPKPKALTVVGAVHGFLFILYILALGQTMIQLKAHWAGLPRCSSRRFSRSDRFSLSQTFAANRLNWKTRLRLVRPTNNKAWQLKNWKSAGN